MPIINTVITGQGGGDKVTALVGSNASSIDVGDKVILNTDLDVDYDTTGLTINSPLYFDGSYLYGTAGIYSAAGSELTYVSTPPISSGNNSMTGSSLETYFTPQNLPPMFTSDGHVCFGCGNLNQAQGYQNPDQCYVICFKDGQYTGMLRYAYNSSYYAPGAALDSRWGANKTGFVSFVHFTPASSSFSDCRVRYYVNGSCTSYTSYGNSATFFDHNGDFYNVDGSYIYSVTYSSSISRSSLFSTNLLNSIAENKAESLAIQGDRVDDYQIWYRINSAILGFSKLDVSNSSFTRVTNPSALQVIEGTIYACWWDLQNRLNVRTSTGLYVFSYSNHDISTMQLVKKFSWSTDYSGPATCSPDLRSYAVGNMSHIKVVTQTAMPIYEFSANVYDGHNFGNTSLTGFVNETPTTDPYGQPIVEVNTVKDPDDTWTNVGTPFGFPVSTTSADVSVGAGYYNSGSAEIIMPSTVTKTLSQASSGQTTGFKNDVVVYHDTLDNNSALICKTGTTPAGTFKASTALTTPVYLSDTKSAIAGTDADSGFDVSYETESPETTYYTVTGSPTITDGVASGFSSGNYLTAQQSTLYQYGDSWEFNTAFMVTSAYSSGTTSFIIGNNSAGYSNLEIYLYQDGSNLTYNIMLRQGAYGTQCFGGARGNTTLNLNTKYYLKVIYINSDAGGNRVLRLEISTDGINYTHDNAGATYSWNYGPSQNRALVMGANLWPSSYPNYFTNGNIYLADTNLYINGQLSWKAMDPAVNGSVTVSDGYKYLDEVDPPFYLASDLTRSATQMVVHPEDFVETSTDVADYTIVGSPTIADKVASGFSENNYLVLPEAFNPSNSSWELLLKVKVKYYSGSNYRYFFSNKDSTNRSLIIGISNSGLFSLYLSSNGSSWDILSGGNGSIYAQDNTDYYIRVKFTGSAYSLEVSTDGTNWSTACSVSSSSKVYSTTYYLGAGYNASTCAFDGSIDLSEGYIKIGNDTWWTPYKTITAKQGTLFLTKPTSTTTSSVIVANTAAVPATNNYEIVGSDVTVDSNHIASGFTSSSYLKIPFGYDPATNSPSFEMVVHIKTPSNVDNGEGIGLQVMDGIANQWWLRFGINSNVTFLRLNGSASSGATYTLSGNTEYYIKVSVTNSAALSISTDGTNYTNVVTLSSTKFSSASGVVDYFYLGYNRADPVFTGSIYLDDCYIKFNGETVWVPYTPGQPSEPVDTSKEYCGSVVDPINKGKVITMDTTLTKILSVEDE